MENKNKPAYPSFERHDTFNEDMGKYEASFFQMGGLTKREYFVAMAAQGLAMHTGADPEGVAKFAVTLADELLKQLEQ